MVATNSDEVSFSANASEARGAAAASSVFTVLTWDIPCHAPPNAMAGRNDAGHPHLRNAQSVENVPSPARVSAVYPQSDRPVMRFR
ncbi:hypothetical protein X765_27850 [Mesorhizobium sp. LSHC440B00]|nr:hypothetical protein X765_27850 [Mesorhizobium sp. LSHC440B00]ESX30863.1 hypothetical protein X764_30835 [Mesorhizobium sp. LSHC440A00]ESX31117.1 hypothetical protein X763_27675 [Mesorhizobium sp. LSHC432A00]